MHVQYPAFPFLSGKPLKCLVQHLQKALLRLGQPVSHVLDPHGVQGEIHPLNGDVFPIQIIHKGRIAVIAADVIAVGVDNHGAQGSAVVDDDALFLNRRVEGGDVRTVMNSREVLDRKSVV